MVLFFNNVCNLAFVYLHEVLNHPDHSLNLRVIIVLNGLMNLAKTQGFQGGLLALGFVNRAFYQGDFYLAHSN